MSSTSAEIQQTKKPAMDPSKKFSKIKLLQSLGLLSRKFNPETSEFESSLSLSLFFWASMISREWFIFKLPVSYFFPKHSSIQLIVVSRSIQLILGYSWIYKRNLNLAGKSVQLSTRRRPLFHGDRWLCCRSLGLYVQLRLFMAKRPKRLQTIPHLDANDQRGGDIGEERQRLLGGRIITKKEQTILGNWELREPPMAPGILVLHRIRLSPLRYATILHPVSWKLKKLKDSFFWRWELIITLHHLDSKE